MKIHEIGTYQIFDINNLKKFDFLADELRRILKINEDHKVMNGMPIAEYARIIRHQIESGYNKFKLLTTIDAATARLVSYSANFIVADDNQEPIVLIYGAYFAPGLLPILLPPKLAYTDMWSSEFNCKKTKFGTTRHAKAYERLMRMSRIGFKVSPLVTFERENVAL